MDVEFDTWCDKKCMTPAFREAFFHNLMALGLQNASNAEWELAWEDFLREEICECFKDGWKMYQFIKNRI